MQFIVLLVPFILLTLSQYNVTKSRVEAEQLTVLELKVEQTNDILNRYKDEVRIHALMIADNPEIIRTVEPLANEDEWSPEDETEPKNYPSDDFSSLGKEAYDDRFEPLRLSSRRMFETLSEEHTYIGNIEIMNKNIVVVMRGHRDKRGDTKTDQLIIDAVNGTSSSGLLVSKRTGQPAIDGTAPIYSNGSIIGAVKVGMYITHEVTKEIESAVGTRFISFDHNAAILTIDPNVENSLVDDAELLIDTPIITQTIDINGNASYVLDEHIYTTYISQGNSYNQLYSISENQNYAISISPLVDYSGEVIGAYMLGLDNEELIGILDYEKQQSYKKILIITALSVLLSFLFSHQIGNPILNLKKKIVKMKNDGAVKHINDIYGPQELLDMAFEINSLIDVISYQQRTNERLEIISNVDGLTNLFNHRKFYQDINLFYQSKTQFSLIFLDLDHFKSINDQLGHSIGDTILREVSNILKKYEEDNTITTYRYGGEEFSVLLKGVNKNEAFEYAENIRSSVESSIILHNISKSLNVTLSAGVAEYPIDSSNLKTFIENADYSMYFSKKNGRNVTTRYSNVVRKFFVEQSDDHLEKNLLLNSVKSLSSALEAKDKYTSDHSKNVMVFSMMLGRKLKLTNSEMEDLRYAALLHDCGKIGISDDILLKKGKLSEKEFKEIKKHSTTGYNIVNNLTTNNNVKLAILHHHEDWDGSGYPRGIEGNIIPPLARIIAIADSYQAMTSNRPYRMALSHNEAIKELEKFKGIKYDPQFTDLMLEALNDDGLYDKKSMTSILEEVEATKEKTLMSQVNALSKDIYENANCNVMLIDLDYNINYISDNTLELIDKPFDQIVNRPCYEAIIGTSKPCQHCKVNEVIENQSIQYQVKHEILRNGTSRNIVQVWVPILDDHEVIKSILEIVIETNPEISDESLVVHTT